MDIDMVGAAGAGKFLGFQKKHVFFGVFFKKNTMFCFFKKNKKNARYVDNFRGLTAARWCRGAPNRG